MVENEITLFDPRTVYVVEECSRPLPSMDLMNSVTYLTASEQCKPMNISDDVRDIRRFALARNSEVSAGSLNYTSSAVGFKNAFFDALLDNRTRHLFKQTCDIQSACYVIMYTRDAGSGQTVGKLLAWAENLCPNVEEGFHPVHKCKANCSFYCSIDGVRIALFQTIDLMLGGVFISQIVGILRHLEMRLVSGDLVRPATTEAVPEPHECTVRAMAKIVRGFYDSL